MTTQGDSERWQRIEDIFLDALDLPQADRGALLETRCDDPEMRREVERMLLADGHDSGFLDSPVASLEEAFAPLNMVTQDLSQVAVADTLPLGDIMMPPEPPRDDPMLKPGNLLCERFRIVEFLAAGGMGEVYKVDDLELGGHVAIKILRPDLTEDTIAMERFRREVQLARRVTHGSVCRSFDIFRHRFLDEDLALDPTTPEVLTFLSMELLQGETLTHRLLRDGPMETAEALPIIRQLADGLEAAHREGIVHRDLKSSNIFLVPGEGDRPRAVVTDFGLARLGSQNDATRRNSVTRSGVTLGTPAYMAPEQIKGEKISPATDIYAFGVLIYEMVTGHFPFEGEDALVTAIRRLHEEPTPPSQFVETLNPRWEQAILRCLQLNPNKRFQSTDEVARFLDGEVTGPLPRWQPQNSKPWWIGAALGGLALLILAATGVHSLLQAPVTPVTTLPEPSESTTTRPAIAVLGFQNLTERDETAWLSIALAEMLTMELAANQTLRAISGEHVARMKLELDLPVTASYAADTLSRIHRYSGAQLVIVGSYFANAGGLRLDLRLENTVDGKTLLLVTENGTSAELPDLVARTGQRLRNRLGIVLAAPHEGLDNSLPSDPEAARLYAQGLAKLRLFDATGAHQDFAAAAQKSPQSPRVYTALAQALQALGRDSEAALAARRAFELMDGLSPFERLRIEGQLRRASGDWVRAAEIFAQLHQSYPDDVELGLQLARIQITAGRGKDALVTLEELRSLPEPTGLDARITIEEALAAESLADYHHGYEAALRAAALAEAQGARWLVARARIRAVQNLWRLGKLDEAEALARTAETSFRQLGDRAGQADALNLLANIHENRGDLEAARSIYEDALAIHRDLGHRAGETKVLNNLAYAMYRIGDYATAEAHYQEALSIAQSIDRKTDIARSLHNMAILRRRQQRLEESSELFEQALALGREIGDRGIQSTSLNNLGSLWRSRNALDRASEYYRQSLELAEQIGDPRGVASAHNNLGLITRKLGRLSEARDHYEEAIAIGRQLDNADQLVRRLVAVANVYRRWGRFEEAQERLQETASHLRDSDRIGLANVRNSTSRLHFERGDFTAARSQLAEALVIYRELGHEQWTPSLEVQLANIDLAEGKTLQAESRLQPHLEAWRSTSGSDDQLIAQRILAACLLERGQAKEASHRLAEGQERRQQVTALDQGLAFDLIRGQVDSELGRLDEALELLSSASRLAEDHEHVLLALELQLALATLDRQRGFEELARKRVIEVQTQAAEGGYGRLTNLAEQQLASFPKS